MKHFYIGIGISIFYFLGILFFINGTKLSMVGSWSEFGDFLAGVFSPLAFLWLVLGYLQQQKELQQNTEALKLQADELKNSVEQYKEMVSVSKQQLKNDARRDLEDRAQKEKELKPDLYMTNLGWSVKSAGRYEYNWGVSSDGKEAKNIRLEFDPPVGIYSKFSFRNNSVDIKLPKNSMSIEDVPDGFRVILSYESTLGYSYVSEYVYTLSADGNYILTHSADFQGTKI